MEQVTRNEFNGLKDDMNRLGDVMRSNLRDYKTDTKDNFKDVWKAIDSMLFKVAAVVTICTSVVMGIFKMIEVTGKGG